MLKTPFRPSRRLHSQGAFATCLIAIAITAGAAAQTTLPIVDSLVDEHSLVLHVRKIAARHHQVSARLHHFARHRTMPQIERPALASVELLQPLPRPSEPPHLVVPLPAYGLDAIATLVTTPPPPVFCHPTRRDPDLPDPRLHRERTVVCEADNP